MRRMTIAGSLLATLLYFIPVSLYSQEYSSGDSAKYVFIPFNLGFVHGVSTGDAVAKIVRREVYHSGVNLTLISGKAAELDGFGFAGILYEYSGNVHGATFSMVQFAGGDETGAHFSGFNKVGGLLRGAQFGYIMNLVEGDVTGAQYAGLFNEAGGNVVGALFSGVGNYVGGDMNGAVFGGAGNYTEGDFTGAEFGGAVNIHRGTFEGALFGGAVNIVHGDIHGAQFAGALAVHHGRTDGVMISGAVNIASHFGKGVQIAPVNIAETHEGIPIGLLSYVKEVGLKYDLWGTETGLMQVGVRSGTRSFYNLCGIGATVGDTVLYSFGAGLGGHFDLTEILGLEIGLYSQAFFQEKMASNSFYTLHTLNLIGVVDLGVMYLTGGPTLNLTVSEHWKGKDIAKWTAVDEETGGVRLKAWPGFNFGLRF